MDVIENARRYVAAMPAAVSGQGGHSKTFDVACRLVNGFALAESDALNLLREYNGRCQPQWSEKELQHKIDQAVKHPHTMARGALLSSSSKFQVSSFKPEKKTAPAKPKEHYGPNPAVVVPSPMADGTRKFLSAVFKPGDGIRISQAKLNDEGLEAPDGGLTLSLSAWLEKLDANGGEVNRLMKSSEGAGIYVAVNPYKIGATLDRDVTEYRHALLEFDGLPLEQQWGLYERSRIPCAAIIFSGGKSIHAWVRIDAGTDLNLWKERVEILYAHFAAYLPDGKNKNPGRYSRLPGCRRFERRQELLALDTGCRSFEEWEREQAAESCALPKLEQVFDFCAREIVKPKPIISGLLYQGAKMVIGGGSKSYKTWIMLDLALCVAFGQPWLSFPVHQGRVAYVNFELREWCWQERIKSVAAAKNISLSAETPLYLQNLYGLAASYEILIPQLIERLRDQNFALTILDPTYKLYGKGFDENSVADVGDLLNSITRFQIATGSALVIASHFSKGNQSGKNAIDRISGSGVIGRDAESLVTFTELEEEGTFSIESKLRECAPSAPFGVRWTFPLMRPEKEIDPTKLKQAKPKKTITERQVMDLLPAAGLDSEDWQRAAEETLGIKSRTFEDRRKNLRKDGLVEQDVLTGIWKKISPKPEISPENENEPF